jgi:NTE family protein
MAMTEQTRAAHQPIEPMTAETGNSDVEEVAGSPTGGVGLCLSGGGFRAMLFHAGALVRLNQLGYLRKLTRVSSVSGGSIIAGTLGLHWDELTWDEHGRATNLVSTVLAPVLELASHTIDISSVLVGVLTPFHSIGDSVAHHYDKHLFHGATLRDLPDDSAGTGAPRFVINATSLQTGKLVRFSRPYIADYSVGRWFDPTTPLAHAVTASSAFPPVLSPYKLRPSGTFDPGKPAPTNDDPEFRKELVLTDGGVYDNLGLQTVWSRCETVLVSDGGAPFAPELDPHGDWVRESVRVLHVIDSQVRALRKRQLIDGFNARRGGKTTEGRLGTYWGVASDTASYPVRDPLAFDHVHGSDPSDVATRLAALDDQQRVHLMRWGYIICDTAMRSWVDTSIAAPSIEDVPGSDGWYDRGGLPAAHEVTSP